MKREELKNVKLIAHRLGYQMTNMPENSIDALKDIFKNKKLLDVCYGFEFDICFTKDNIPVLIHDKFIDDICEYDGLVNQYYFNDLKKISFRSRSSIKNDIDIKYNLITLDEVLNFFQENIKLLGNKIIKIETKDYFFSNLKNTTFKKLNVLSDILNKYPEILPNIVHLSFWPLNLIYLKKIQKKKQYYITKSDLLCDGSYSIYISKLMPNLDNISLRVKTNDLPKVDKNNSKRVNKKIKQDIYWMKKSNCLNEKDLKYCFNRFESINLYTINSKDEINEIVNNISSNFKDRIVITTDNPFNFNSLLK